MRPRSVRRTDKRVALLLSAFVIPAVVFVGCVGGDRRDHIDDLKGMPARSNSAPLAQRSLLLGGADGAMSNDASLADANDGAMSNDASLADANDDATSNGGGGGPIVPGPASVLGYHNHASRDGLYVDPAFTRARMATLHRDTSFSAPLSGQPFAQPLYVDGGPDGRDVVIVATEANQLYAYDPVDGAEIYHRSLGAAFTLGQGACGNITPLGVTGTPVIDPATRTLYLDAMTKITGVGNHHVVHSISVDTGLDNWTVDVDATARFGSLAFSSQIQNQRGALAFLNGRVYIAYGGYFGDCGAFHGWVVGVSADGQTVNGWATRANGGGIWGPGSVASDGTSLYVATGNTIGATVWGDGEAIIRLAPGPSFSQSPADYFAPPNWKDLDNLDADLGGSNVMLFHLPGAAPRDLALALGKNGNAYLADRANLGGFNTLAVQQVGNFIITAPSAYHTPLGTYAVFNGGGPGCPGGTTNNAIRALKIGEGSPPTITVAWCANAAGSAVPIASPVVTTTDGTSDAAVWWIGADRKLRANDGDTGAPLFEGGGPSDVVNAVQRSQAPIVAKGHIFVAASQQLHKFSL